MKKTVSVLLCLFSVLSVLFAIPFTASAVEASQSVDARSGNTGECKWTLDENGVLTISGSGDMANYQLKEPFDPYRETAPWGEDISRLVIEDGVTHIGSAAFGRCVKLTSVTIPDSVTSIGNYAFYNCDGITDVTIPDSVTDIDNCAFESCHNLTSVTVPNSIISIGSYAFDHCSSLKSVYIDDLAAWCRITFGNTYANPLSNGGDLYVKGEKISDLVIPDGVVRINDHAFNGGLISSSVITSVTIPDSVISIGDSSFNNCKNLAEINIPDSVTYIAGYAFSNTAWYDNQPDGLVYIGKVAYSYKGTMPENTFVEIKYGTVNISEHAFYQCNGLSGVRIPSSVTGIGEDAFYGCSDLTIYGKAGSYAAEYSRANQLKFFEVDEVIVGDVNLDGQIDVIDVTAIQKHLAGLIHLSDEQLVLSDTNGDGEINITDATHLQKYLAGFDGIVLGKQS